MPLSLSVINMTLLINALRHDYLLSLTDRRTTVQTANGFELRDERANKHLWVAWPLGDGSDRLHRAAITYTGVSEWRLRNGTHITTDRIIATGLTNLASTGGTVSELADAIARALRPYVGTTRQKPHDLLVVVTGYSEIFQEPWYAIVSTDEPSNPAESGDLIAQLPLSPPFYGFVVVPDGPRILINGMSSAVSDEDARRLKRILDARGSSAYELSCAAVDTIRRASARSAAVGSRVSALVAPANGVVDIAFWDDVYLDPVVGFPWMIRPGAFELEASEARITFNIVGSPRRHALAAHQAYAGRMPKRVLRKLRRSSKLDASPTIMDLLSTAFFGRPVAE